MWTKVAILLQCILFCTQSATAVNVEMVTVGNPGNAPDTRYYPAGVGSVNHVYQIGKFEITAGQYAEFLNAVAKDDPSGLYNTAMGTPLTTYDFYGANIQRAGSSPTFSYSIAPDWVDRPVNFVSFWDAARFVNWLHNGQPVGPQGPGTTEDGAYHDIGNPALFGRSPHARFFLPTEDEWYKAAYHQNDGVTSNYWSYPTGTDLAPINTLPDSGNHANFYDHFGTGNSAFTISVPYYRTIVGEFNNSPSPYATFDQGGNLWEWNETPFGNASRGIRGGSFWFGGSSMSLHASDRNWDDSWDESFGVGFRVAAPVPEPTSTALFSMAAMVLSASHFRTRRG